MDRLRSRAVGWFPGQMARTRRLINENLPLVNVVVEVADARAPRATRHPGLGRLVRDRPILTVLAKADLAEPRETSRWVSALSRGQPGAAAVAFERDRPDTVRAVRRLALELAGRRGPARSPLRAMVVGLPNVGKSTLINCLAGRAAARTGDRPGLTVGKQWLKAEGGVRTDDFPARPNQPAGRELWLLDLPGVLVPGRLDPGLATVLAVLGILPPEAYDPVRTALDALDMLVRTGRLPAGLRADGEPFDGAGFLERYAARRGCLLPGGRPDLERAAVALLTALRDGRFGPLTLESPEEASD